jgi:hypothetical protein
MAKQFREKGMYIGKNSGRQIIFSGERRWFHGGNVYASQWRVV